MNTLYKLHNNPKMTIGSKHLFFYKTLILLKSSFFFKITKQSSNDNEFKAFVFYKTTQTSRQIHTNAMISLSSQNPSAHMHGSPVSGISTAHAHINTREYYFIGVSKK